MTYSGGMKIFWLVLVAVAAYLLISISPHYTKVTNPSDPKFKSDKFSFEDYSRDEMAHVMSVMFPPGTPRKFVDHVLVTVGGAIAFPHQGHENEIRYLYTSQSLLSKIHPWRRNVGVKYDDQNRVMEAYIGPIAVDHMKEEK